MSITVVRDKGVTVVTVASDSKSVLPPLCQILKSVCYSPVCCSVYKGLMQTNVVSALGAIQIMVGLFNIGLGIGRTSYYYKDIVEVGAAYWLGGVFIAVGIISVLAGRFPSLCLVGIAVFMNIIGSAFGIAGIVAYAIDLGHLSVDRMCGWDRDYGHSNNCRGVAHDLQKLLTGIDITMIVLAVLQLCVCISFAVLGIKALLNWKKNEQGDEDVEICKPLLTDDPTTSPSV